MAIKFVLKQTGSNGRDANGAPPAEFVFDGAMFTFGSDATNNLILSGSAAEQAVVVREGEQLTLINSADGTTLNGENLPREAIHPLAGGDEIRVGNYTVLVVDDESGDTNNNNNGAPHAREAEPDAPAFEKILTVGAVDKNRDSSAEQTSAEIKVSSRKAKSTDNFAAVLDTLRTEEDSFYFVVKEKDAETGRIALEQAEIPIGANDKNEIVFDIKKMSAVFGVVRKDWSGIILEANRRGALFVNGEPLDDDAPRRLRNDDRVSFAAPVKSLLVLHEPSLLVALEPLLSARAVSGNGVNNTAAISKISATTKTAKPKLPLFERTLFNHFSFIEVLTMIIGTLIGAVLFFLFFEFMFS